MSEWEAPAKLNLDLRLQRLDSRGMHPLRSLVQTIEWCDLLAVEVGDEDQLHLTGPCAESDIPDGGDNLVWKAVQALQLSSRPRLDVVLDKQVASAAGLGGGSSDAAAMLLAMSDLLRLGDDAVRLAAEQVGADVPYFLTGGTAVVEGYGEKISSAPPIGGLAFAVAVPRFELSTPEVYRRWDELDGPVGAEVATAAVPPALRSEGPFRNDLTAAAVSIRPELADWMSDLAERWGRAVMMSGSGPACFAYFLDEDEATHALTAVGENRAKTAALSRPRGAALR